MTTFFIIAAVLFLGYAVFTYYQSTPTDQSVAKRVWSSVVLAVGSIAGAVTSWFTGGTPPPATP
jgi:hypothetical protein